MVRPSLRDRIREIFPSLREWVSLVKWSLRGSLLYFLNVTQRDKHELCNFIH